jgi:LytS/YehU family sensor histidine kinase
MDSSILPEGKTVDLSIGFLGGLTLFLLQGKIPVKVALSMMLIGLISAYVFPDMIMGGFHLDPLYRSGIDYGCGLLGMQVVNMIVLAVNSINLKKFLGNVPYIGALFKSGGE